MKRVLLVAAFTGAGAAFAAPAPVVDVSNVSTPQQSSVEKLEQRLKHSNQRHYETELLIKELQREISQLRGQNEELSYKVEQILKRQRELYSTVSELKSAPAPTQTTPNSNLAINQSEKSDYDTALNLAIKDKKFAESIAAFNAFIAKYPQSAMVPNAHYWAGQLHFNLNQLSEAKKAFLQVISAFPSSNKRPESMYKMGMLSKQQKNPSMAKKWFKQLISEYPNEQATALAKKELAALK